MPGRIAKGPRELDSARDILGIERVRVLDEQVGVEELFGEFVGIGLRRVGEAEMDSVIVARDDRVTGGSFQVLTQSKPSLSL